jgi:hypothetical protein
VGGTSLLIVADSYPADAGTANGLAGTQEWQRLAQRRGELRQGQNRNCKLCTVNSLRGVRELATGKPGWQAFRQANAFSKLPPARNFPPSELDT